MSHPVSARADEGALRRRCSAAPVVALAFVLTACGPRQVAPAAAPAAHVEPARVVVQTKIDPNTYLVQTGSGHYAVFAQAVVDLRVQRVSRTDFEGTIAHEAAGDQVYRTRADGSVELFDLSTGERGAVEASEGQTILREAPVQTWSSHQGMIENGALAKLTPETRARVATLVGVEPAIVLDIDAHAERLLTATNERVCLWSLQKLARERCVPRAFQSYELLADQRLRVHQVMPSGEEQVGMLSSLAAQVEWLSAADRQKLSQASLAQPCQLDLLSGPTENLFVRAQRKLFTLHDFGKDGWAIVLPDGRYAAEQVPPKGLAFFEADGRLCSEVRVRSLAQPEAVREALLRGAHKPAGCSF